MATVSPIYWPFSTSLVTEWPGTRPAGWAYHVGTDFGVPQGTPLRATVSGTVYLTWNDGYGAYVLDIVRPDGFVVRNGHLSRMDVPHGSWVNAGQHIGLTGGAKGTPGAGLSTGSHLHWELRWNRNWSGPGWVHPRNLSIRSFGDTPSKPTTKPTTTSNEEEDENMANFWIKKKEKNYWYHAIVNPVSGFFHEFQTNSTSYAANIAKTFGVTAPSSIVTLSHYTAIKRDCATTRQGK